MNHSTASRQGAPGSLARLDEVIAEIEGQLVRYRAARAVLLELDGTPAAPAATNSKAPRAAAETPPARQASALSGYNQQKSENARAANRLAIARLLLAEGPLPFNRLFRLSQGRGHSWITKTCRSSPDWFCKIGERPTGVDSRPWGLTPQGRTEATAMLAAERKPARTRAKPAATSPRSKPRKAPRGGSAPAEPAGEPPAAARPPAEARDRSPGAADIRANPVLDAEFEDLFMPEARGGKQVPRPSLNGTGRGHHPPPATTASR